MTPAQLSVVLTKFGAVRVGTEIRARCPLHQGEDTDPTDYKLALNPGRSCPLVFCCSACFSWGVDNKEYNRNLTREIAAAVGVNLKELSESMESEEIESLWEAVGILAGARHTIEPADDETLNKAYSFLLQQLTLSSFHQEWLSKRGMTSGEALGYRTAPTKDESKGLVDCCEKEFGADVLRGVPGFTIHDNKKSVKFWSRHPAIFTPCRNVDSKILAIKQRLTTGRDRLRLLTSSHQGGPHSLSPCHVPLGVADKKRDELWITEGERKADVHWLSTSKPTVSIPGIGQWRGVVTILEGLLSSQARVVVALDQDKKESTRERVAAVTDAILKTVQELGHRTSVATWQDHKGLDDAVIAGANIIVTERSGNTVSPTVFEAKESSTSYTGSRYQSDYVRAENVIDYLRETGPVLRGSFRTFELQLTKMIQSGEVKMRKVKEGQQLWVE